ncbi:WW Rsp5 WWP domain containing [Pyrrhoderma noxium]|uniref:WW Rsp5 WWP domain containing n=1 Tax=Pyrrhoderma noxium TaxID=2282107 RepID=A0A286URU1_9AGAM|nr:WW Rsp5 WWP domain containing [Pyrrhoderma noxium]
MIDEKDTELPDGWIKEFDRNYNAYFYVDTKASPPRSIWVHPYKDEQFLNEHPEVRKRLEAGASPPPSYTSYSAPSGPPPALERRGSSTAGSSSMSQDGDTSTNSKDKGKRGFFGKIKDKAIGTKEEREAAKREEQRVAEERRRILAAERQQRQQHMYYDQQQRYQQQGGYGQQYGVPQGGYYGGGAPAGYGPGYPGQTYYPVQQQQQQRRSGLGGGMALPLLGGLAGGLLLGEAIDGFDGGDFGGGDFGGDF